MAENFDLQRLADDLLRVMHNNGLNPDAFVVSATISKQDFADMAKKHPGHHPRLISQGGEFSGVQWAIQLSPRRELGDFPPGIIIPPPTNL